METTTSLRPILDPDFLRLALNLRVRRTSRRMRTVRLTARTTASRIWRLFRSGPTTFVLPYCRTS